MNNCLSQYIDLLSSFIQGEVGADEFQIAYLAKFKNETHNFDESTYELLDSLFGDVDAYTSNKDLLKENPKYYLDEGALRTRVSDAIAKLWGK